MNITDAQRRVIVMRMISCILALAIATWASQAAHASNHAELKEWSQAEHSEVHLETDQFADEKYLRQLIGDARIVSFGEGLHGAAESLEFRNRLFRFLAEEMGFTAIAIESAIAPGFLLTDYVQNGQGDGADLVRRGITFGLHRYPEQRELIEWMREYNATAQADKQIAFYGMDVSRLAGDGEEEGALDVALRCLSQVDPDAAAGLKRRVEPYRANLKLNRIAPQADDYMSLSQSERDAVTGVIDDLLTMLRINEGAYVQTSSPESVRRCDRVAVAASQADDYLRQTQLVPDPSTVQSNQLRMVAVADRSKADNVAWILEEHERLLVFSHMGHAATTSVEIRMPERPAMQLPPLFGSYLQRWYGAELLTIGHLVGHDRTSCEAERPPAADASIEGSLSDIDASAFLLDLRQAPPAVVEESLAPIYEPYATLPIHAMSLRAGLDGLLFTQRATTASPCRLK